MRITQKRIREQVLAAREALNARVIAYNTGSGYRAKVWTPGGGLWAQLDGMTAREAYRYVEGLTDSARMMDSHA